MSDVPSAASSNVSAAPPPRSPDTAVTLWRDAMQTYCISLSAIAMVERLSSYDNPQSVITLITGKQLVFQSHDVYNKVATLLQSR